MPETSLRPELPSPAEPGGGVTECPYPGEFFEFFFVGRHFFWPLYAPEHPRMPLVYGDPYFLYWGALSLWCTLVTALSNLSKIPIGVTGKLPYMTRNAENIGNRVIA